MNKQQPARSCPPHCQDSKRRGLSHQDSTVTTETHSTVQIYVLTSAWILRSLWTSQGRAILFFLSKRAFNLQQKNRFKKTHFFTSSKSTPNSIKYSAPKIFIKVRALQSGICDLRIMKQVLWAAEYYKSFLISFRVVGKGELLKEKMIDHICLWVIRLPIRRNGIL